MQDKCYTVSLWSLAAALFWTVAALLVLGGAFTDRDDATQIGLGISAAAATLSMRGFSVRLGSEIQNAFDLGRDVGRAETDAVLRSLH